LPVPGHSTALTIVVLIPETRVQLNCPKCFSEKAIVFDEGKTYNGRTEIKQWIQKANNKYKTVVKPNE
jgi:hypothetical protein